RFSAPGFDVGQSSPDASESLLLVYVIQQLLIGRSVLDNDLRLAINGEDQGVAVLLHLSKDFRIDFQHNAIALDLHEDNRIPARAPLPEPWSRSTSVESCDHVAAVRAPVLLLSSISWQMTTVAGTGAAGYDALFFA